MASLASLTKFGENNTEAATTNSRVFLDTQYLHECINVQGTPNVPTVHNLSPGRCIIIWLLHDEFKKRWHIYYVLYIYMYVCVCMSCYYYFFKMYILLWNCLIRCCSCGPQKSSYSGSWESNWINYQQTYCSNGIIFLFLEYKHKSIFILDAFRIIDRN